MLSTRRKSCRACVKSKRRCDLGLPSCDRCLVKRVCCEYPWTELDNGNSAVSSLGHQGFSLISGTSSDMNNNPLCPSNPITIPRPLSPAMEALLGGLVNSIETSSLNFNFATASITSELPLTGHPVSSVEGAIPSSSRFQARTEYVGRRIASQAVILAQTGQTAFIHHSQVGSSSVLQEALAASCLHAMRNPSNAEIVKSEIERRAALLIQAVERLLVRHTTVQLDLLPPVQALLIYQCIRLFSTMDITQQGQAEHDATYLTSWATRLRQRIQTFDTPKCWMDWVCQESVRRAVLFSEVVSGVYTFLKFRWDGGERVVDNLGFTAQAALWEARSTVEWELAWSKFPRLELTVSTFGRDTEKAKPDDFEELGIIFRATFTGLEALEQWLGGDRETLRRWGLREERVSPQY
ncbi:fungal zn2-cys6 binuclear cluster domain-containing protein [Fusarium sporotrichioides]|uniref:Fungal zn2-cys6 binuclear cluster domain-containing protein n=1 Tax=Fusarium sporotrichioides TaxID=5514 RepID=A0A395RKH7_FUSSP|nr:fungal zn2-cys6 binuclear cluster domain-containing protein [Fusarium sporotrichioides]